MSAIPGILGYTSGNRTQTRAYNQTPRPEPSEPALTRTRPTIKWTDGRSTGGSDVLRYGNWLALKKAKFSHAISGLSRIPSDHVTYTTRYIWTNNNTNVRHKGHVDHARRRSHVSVVDGEGEALEIYRHVALIPKAYNHRRRHQPEMCTNWRTASRKVYESVIQTEVRKIKSTNKSRLNTKHRDRLHGRVQVTLQGACDSKIRVIHVMTRPSQHKPPMLQLKTATPTLSSDEWHAITFEWDCGYKSQ